MWQVVLLEQAEEEPEARVLDLFVPPFQTGGLAAARQQRQTRSVASNRSLFATQRFGRVGRGGGGSTVSLER